VVSNAEEIPRLCPSRARRRPARSRGECPARQRAGCTRFPSTAVDRSVVFDVYLLVSGIAQAIAAFTVGVSPGSRVWLFISGAVSVALGYFAFRDFKQRRRRVDAGHMDRRWIHIPRCHGDRIGDRCSSTARAGLVRVCRDPDCDRRRGDACLADQSIDAFRRFHAALHSHQAAETDYLVLAMSTGVSVPGY